MREIIEKYFKEGKSAYYNPADIIADDNYLAYEWRGGKLIISVGSNEGEIALKVFSKPDGLEEFIKMLLY